ncbi:MAG: hypothetical protein JW795_14780 [Chitinivibrionales bacterium]|nr:hypothetical protein [Chitinivibrionales bacterium]
MIQSVRKFFGIYLILCAVGMLCHGGTAAAIAAYSPNINLSTSSAAELDAFIMRIACKSDIMVPRTYLCKPMHVGEVLLFFKTADSLNRTGVLRLSEDEAYACNRFITTLAGSSSFISLQDTLRNSQTHVDLKLLGDITPFYSKQDNIHLTGIINPQLNGSFSQWSYFCEVEVWSEYRSDTLFHTSTYEPFDGNPYNLYGRKDSSSIRSSDMFRGGISYAGEWFSLESAVDYLRQGPARFYPLTFSGMTNPVTYFRTKIDLSHFDYTHSFGLLRMQKDKSKYFYMHRLDLSLLRNQLLCGFTEVVINGTRADRAQSDSLPNHFTSQERDWEWLYLLPFVPFKFAEHYGGDRDNIVMSVDVTALYPRSFCWYLEFFLDDMSAPWTLFSNDFGNKWACTIGGTYITSLSNHDCSVGIEYSRVEPWVYTHFRGASHSYTHYGRSLGSPLGPNSDAFVFAARYGVRPNCTVGVSLINERTNRQQRGGDITHVFQQNENGSKKSDSKTKEFLGKDYDNCATINLTCRFIPRDFFFIDARLFGILKESVGLSINGGFIF